MHQAATIAFIYRYEFVSSRAVHADNHADRECFLIGEYYDKFCCLQCFIIYGVLYVHYPF